MEELKRYTDQTVGENEMMERYAIAKFFPDADIIKVDDKELQYQGVDYIVSKNGRKCYIDTKVHHFDSNYFVYECYDTRPNYANYGWTNPNIKHLTTYIIYIVPAYRKAYLYNYKELMDFQQDDAFKYADYTETKHPNGFTINKIFKTDFINNKETDIIVPDNILIKKNHIPANSTNAWDVALKKFGSIV